MIPGRSVFCARSYADLQKRFNAVKQEWTTVDTERQAMKHALIEARKHVETLSRQNKHLTSLLDAVRLEHARLSQAKETVMKALDMHESLDLTTNATA